MPSGWKTKNRGKLTTSFTEISTFRRLTEAARLSSSTWSSTVGCSVLVETKANFQGDLKMRHLSRNDVAASFDDFKPLDVAD